MLAQFSRPVAALLMLMATSIALADEQFVAATFAKAAGYIFNRDHAHSALTSHFSADELSTLLEHQEALDTMIHDALSMSDSVGGALLVGHFELDEHIPLLRFYLFRPGTAYGWEGPDYDSEEDYLTDNQFVYHSIYLEAIEAASGRPIHEAVQPTDREIQELFRLLEDPTGEHYYWAKWLARKLLLLPPEG